MGWKRGGSEGEGEDIMGGGRWKGVGRYYGRRKVEGSRKILWDEEGERE